MSTPSSTAPETDGMPQTSTPSAGADEGSMDEIPPPRTVKVLYTFDHENKSNCLARLPSVLSVPVVSLDETTEVGVIELKTCIQAIVAASPELVAKLGHDYTVYAYDFSEYETPLVGQGMLSWILASASSTPNAPAKDSQTMVTGRVCKNILGIFSNGIKETLEVKLKLVPVPTCMQKEYVENMERYHSLSQLMPEGFDYNAWSDFLKENPMLSHLAQPAPGYPAQPSPRASTGGVEPFHQMLTRQSPSQEPSRNDSFYDQTGVPYMSQPMRPSSPALSTVSFHHYQYNPPSRPASRTSVRSEAVPPPQPFPFSDPYVVEQQEEGPPKKRARITQTTRPRNTPLTAHNDSLRVTASTAASVRLLKPALSASGAAADMVPRAPTPRPGEKQNRRGMRRPPAPSALRHGSMDRPRYMSPYENGPYSDNAMESADERDGSPSETPREMPSSPPIAPQRTVSPAPSSPNLPTLSMNDSGFVSDMPTGREGMDLGDKSWHRKSTIQPIAESIEMDLGSTQGFDFDSMDQDMFNSVYFQEDHTKDDNDLMSRMSMLQQDNDHAAGQNGTTDACASGLMGQTKVQNLSRATVSTAGSPDAMVSHVSPTAESEALIFSRSATPNLPVKHSKPSKPRGLPRSHTWSGTGEPMSDAPTPSEYGGPRSGSGAKRKRYIKDRLEAAIAKGEMPPHCVNCGEIDTPTWRKAYTRVENGSPTGLELSTDSAGTDIIAYELVEPSTDSDGEPRYRIFKNNLTREDKDLMAAKSNNAFEELNLCNPCGLWLIKKFSMRPQKVWDRAARLAKRKRDQKMGARSKSIVGDELMSDAPLPESEPAMPAEQELGDTAHEKNHDGAMAPPNGLPGLREQAAFQRAMQSSPAGVRGSKASPIDLEHDLTPKPTRRILFPSPGKQGQQKTLQQPPPPIATPMHVHDDDAPKRPRCQRCKELKRGCDRERPCGRCRHAGIGHDGCIPIVTKQANWFEQPVVQVATLDDENPDKENCPPPSSTGRDELAHLFEDAVSPKTTPKKDLSSQDLLKTPTPGTRQRATLTPKRGELPATPGRSIFTPRGTRAATIAPETPFTRSLNALLSDHPISSPSQTMDFSEFPTFTTPGRSAAEFSQFLPEDFLSSDMPVNSSPSKTGSLGPGFDLYEDPNTSSAAGLWNGENIFGNETMMLTMENGSRRGSLDADNSPDAAALLKMNYGGMTVDFAAMIEEVVGASNKDMDLNNTAREDTEDDVKPAVPISPEAESQCVGKTPEEPTSV
ncbi:GAL4 domain-containing protein [Pyrenophora tritici-repentis]|nr:GAL4 domain containing protein [Pyrenophora tritici-repentis]KAI0576751.1 GAL4 domain-containing protein [Pyrenophora tritici-repentis]KAI0581253.1 GAL4 domain-containing protein [Pyrenophora tritici-repentis]KAI0609089.1 GAL4 domain-containing protein [Pyrenophora tritici-repentis]KAI1576661.1 GAL4 domain containing protein [Pyrenophora tritici-repentis]